MNNSHSPQRQRILFDGWDVAFSPNSPAALHTLSMITWSPEWVEPVLALPGPRPPWVEGLFDLREYRLARSPRQRLIWEQQLIPTIGREMKAALIHTAGGYPALFSRRPYVISSLNCSFRRQKKSIYARLREAIGEGAKVGSRGVFWPKDLPLPKSRQTKATYLLSPAVHPDFILNGKVARRQVEHSPGGFPDAYALYHGRLDGDSLGHLLDAWRWVVHALGDAFPLLVVGCAGESRKELERMARRMELGQSVRAVDAASPRMLARYYQYCRVVFHPHESSPWGGGARLAIWMGKPLVALETQRTDNLVGPAAYLVTRHARAQGAALITILLEDDVAGKLSAQARERAQTWQSERTRKDLAAAYREILGI